MKVLTSLLIAVGIAVPVIALASSGDKEPFGKERKRIRSYFTVTGDCSIEFNLSADAAASFWNRFDPYLNHMIPLAASLQITDPAGVASYVMLALFPECDQTKEQTLSFKAVFAALEFRLGNMME